MKYFIMWNCLTDHPASVLASFRSIHSRAAKESFVLKKPNFTCIKIYNMHVEKYRDLTCTA